MPFVNNPKSGYLSLDGLGIELELIQPGNYEFIADNVDILISAGYLILESSANLDSDGYSSGPALTTGISIYIIDEYGEIKLDVSPKPIQKTGQWGLIADMQIMDFGTGPTKFFQAKIAPISGKYLLRNGERIRIVIPEVIVAESQIVRIEYTTVRTHA